MSPTGVPGKKIALTVSDALSISLILMRIKILLIRLSAIGDVVHALPALNSLRTVFPDAQIDWLVEEVAAPLLRGHPQLDSVYIFQNRWRRKFGRYLFSQIVPFFKRLRAEKYDWAIDFQGLTKSGLAAYVSGAKRIIGFGDKDGRELNKLFTNVKVHPAPGLHIVEKNLALLTPLGIKNPPINFVFPNFGVEMPPSDEAKSFVAINPGAGWITKRLPLATLASLATHLFLEKKLEIVITWGPGEQTMAERLHHLIERCGGQAVVAPPTDLPHLFTLISRASLFIGGDTGPTHIAAVLGVPVLSYFGASDARRNRPYSPDAVVIQKNEIPCVPCWKTHCRYKDKRRLVCLKSITAAELYNGAEKLLQKR